MSKRKHLPPLTAGEKYDGWMPFCDGEPAMTGSGWFDKNGNTDEIRCAQVYAAKGDARVTAEDVRHVTIIVDRAKERR